MRTIAYDVWDMNFAKKWGKMTSIQTLMLETLMSLVDKSINVYYIYIYFAMGK